MFPIPRGMKRAPMIAAFEMPYASPWYHVKIHLCRTGSYRTHDRVRERDHQN